MTTKQFEKLGKAKKRVVIAQDVIANIKSGKYTPRESYYVDKLNIEGSIKDQFDEIQDCKVCALGSCILSIVKFENNLTAREVDLRSADDFVESAKIRNLLSLAFDKRQLALIEAAFEKGVNFYTNGEYQVPDQYELTSEESKATKKFYKRFKSDKTRLIGIMSNIIKNNGEFIP